MNHLLIWLHGVTPPNYIDIEAVIGGSDNAVEILDPIVPALDVENDLFVGDILAPAYVSGSVDLARFPTADLGAVGHPGGELLPVTHHYAEVG